MRKIFFVEARIGWLNVGRLAQGLQRADFAPRGPQGDPGFGDATPNRQSLRVGRESLQIQPDRT